MRTGFHPHRDSYTLLEGKIPIEVFGDNTDKNVIIQIDTGEALFARADPVAIIKRFPGRIRSLHVKDWSPNPAKGFSVLVGEGIGKWKEIFAAAETVGGIENYLIEQEGSRFPPMDTAARCLTTMRRLLAVS